MTAAAPAIEVFDGTGLIFRETARGRFGYNPFNTFLLTSPEAAPAHLPGAASSFRNPFTPLPLQSVQELAHHLAAALSLKDTLGILMATTAGTRRQLQEAISTSSRCIRYLTIHLMVDLAKIVLTAIRERWHTHTGLGIALCAALLLLTYFFEGFDISQISAAEWTIVIVALVVLYIVWELTALPRVPRDRVGFAVAIQFENSTHAQRLRSDFVFALRGLLTAFHFRHEFYFMELPSGIANTIADEETARRIATRANIHFLLYGRARLRETPEGRAPAP